MLFLICITILNLIFCGGSCLFYCLIIKEMNRLTKHYLDLQATTKEVKEEIEGVRKGLESSSKKIEQAIKLAGSPNEEKAD